MYAAHTFDLPLNTVATRGKKPQNRLFQRLISCQPSFALYFKDSAKRKDVEQYIHDKFQSVYGAELNQYMPSLLSMQINENFNSTLGIRSAAEEKLFVEQYCNQSIEQEIKDNCKVVVNRDKIIEIGNLTAIKPGTSLLLMIVLTAFLYRSGYHWATFVATDDVQKITQKLGFTTYKLCEAKSHCLQGDAKQWGNYYDTNPYLIAGDLREAYKQLQNHRLFSLALSYFDKNIARLSGEFDCRS